MVPMPLSSLIHILLLVTVATAWQFPQFKKLEPLVQKRQDSSTSAATVSSTATATSSAASGVPTSITSSASQTTSSSGSASSSGAGSSTGTKTSGSSSSSSSSSSTTSTSIDPALPPGGIEVITPSAVATTYYKIGDYITFSWNYTSLSVTPSAIDVMASCSVNNQLYTIALNQSVQPTGSVTWDTGDYQATASIPLLTETYTLIVYDAASSISATAQAGYLEASDDYTFGMYIPQAYTPLNEFKCATCASGALSDMERHALGFVFGMATITLLSFTWFVAGFGALI